MNYDSKWYYGLQKNLRAVGSVLRPAALTCAHPSLPIRPTPDEHEGEEMFGLI